MNWIEILLMGLVLGLSEFVPISSSGHERLLLHLFGQKEMDPLCHLVLTFGVFLAVVTGCRELVRRLMVERAISKRRRKTRSSRTRHYDYRIVKTAVLPLSVVYVALSLLPISVSLPALSIAFVINGIVLFVTENMRRGNKESSRMTALDSWMMGFFGGMSAIAGISLTGMVFSVSVARGAKLRFALGWSFMIAVPALLLRMAVDLLFVLIGGTTLTFAGFLWSLLGAIFAFAGGRASINIAKSVVKRANLAEFFYPYYIWGAAILTFILFLIT